MNLSDVALAASDSPVKESLTLAEKGITSAAVIVLTGFVVVFGDSLFC